MVILTRHPIAHARLEPTDSFSYLFWFKTNSQPDAFSQLLAKKDDTFSSYFVQVEPDGKSLKTIIRSFGEYYDNGSIPFLWTNGTNLHLPLMVWFSIPFWMGNGLPVENPLWSIDTNDGDLGVGGTANGSNLFKGWIDDLRFYDTTLHPRDVKESYGKGAGDFGGNPFFSVNRATSVMPVNVSLSFLDSDLFPVTIQDLNLSDFQLDGGTVSNLQQVGMNYTFDLNSVEKPKRITIQLPAGVCRDDQNISNSFGSVVVYYGDIVTKAEDLVGWWTFDELNGTTVSDNAGAGSTAYLLGDPTLDSTDPALGTNSLLLDGDGDSAKIFGLRKNISLEAYRHEDLELWWPLDGNYSDMSGNGRKCDSHGE